MQARFPSEIRKPVAYLSSDGLSTVVRLDAVWEL